MVNGSIVHPAAVEVLVATPTVVLGWVGAAPGLFGKVNSLMFTKVKCDSFIVRAECHTSVSGAGTAMTFTLMHSWNFRSEG